MVKNLPANAREIRNAGKVSWRRKRQPTAGFLPGEAHAQRSLEGYSPRGRTESDSAQWAEHTHTFLRETSTDGYLLCSLQTPKLQTQDAPTDSQDIICFSQLTPQSCSAQKCAADVPDLLLLSVSLRTVSTVHSPRESDLAPPDSTAEE